MILPVLGDPHVLKRGCGRGQEDGNPGKRWESEEGYENGRRVSCREEETGDMERAVLRSQKGGMSSVSEPREKVPGMLCSHRGFRSVTPTYFRLLGFSAVIS